MKSKEKGVNKKIIIVLAIIVLIIAIFLLIKYINKDKLSYYENKMIEYGLAQKYNNGTPNDKDYVTKSEAVKMVIETIINGRDISEFTNSYGNDFYDNLTHVIYGMNTGIVNYDYITIDNEAENVPLIDAINMIYKSRNKIFIPKDGIQKDVEKDSIVIKYKSEYTQDEIDAISDLIQYGMLPSNFKYKKDKILTKKVFNEILVKFYEKYIK